MPISALIDCVRLSCCVCLVTLILAMQHTVSAEEPAAESAPNVSEIIRKASQADTAEDALELANQAVELDPESKIARYFRAQVLTALRKHAAAVKDYDQLIKSQPNDAELYYRRGRSRFCAAQVEGSVEDFNKYVELEPSQASRQWERGIALYYAGEFEKGADQFALYQTYHDNDVENATWRYLCMAQDVGVEKAKAELLPIENDRRVPMMQIYALYRGELKPEDVMKAASEVDSEGPAADARLNQQLFYAHLYLGLYYEAQGDDKLAKEHLITAADKHPIGHYMWDVAKLHSDRVRGEKQKP